MTGRGVRDAEDSPTGARGVDGTGQVSVKDVARRAGVSLGTVSNVLNRPQVVSPATQRKVLRAISELGFVRNEAARQLRAGRSRVIGMIVLDVANPFFTDLAAGVESAATDAGLSLMLCNSGENSEQEARYLALLEEQRCFGILITPLDGGRPLLRTIRRRGTNIVFADRQSEPGLCSVTVDDVAGGAAAARHLFDLGHRRIAFVGGPPTLPQVADRLAGVRQAIGQRASDAVEVTVVPTAELTIAAGKSAGAQIGELSADHRPTAVFCANDLVALGLIQEMVRRKINVPQEISIVGYDDIDFAAASHVPLTSVRQPRHQLGRAAAELLIDETLRPESHSHRQVVFSPELIVRESTGRANGRQSAPS